MSSTTDILRKEQKGFSSFKNTKAPKESRYPRNTVNILR